MSELPASGGGVFPESGETGGDEDDVVFRLCKLWTCLGRLKMIGKMLGWGRSVLDREGGRSIAFCREMDT